MAKTGSTDVVDALQQIPVSTLIVGAEYSLSNSYAHTLGIYLALTNNGLAVGADIIVQIKMGTDKFIDYQQFSLGVIAAPDTDVLDGGVSVTDTTITVLTGGTDIDTIGKLWLLDVDATPEIRRTKSITGKVITLVDKLLNSHNTASDIYAGVTEWTIQLPLEAIACRVLYNNKETQNPFFAGTDITKVTAL